jgi:phosphoribosylformylglycinamidine cyclo-ligase
VADVILGFADGCAENGCALLGGETAEMPGTYRPGEYDLAATIVGVVEEDDLLPRRDVAPGDVLIGLRSSGLHTNGFSLARTALFERGGLSADDTPRELGGRSVADALLAVHRTYAPLLLPLLPQRRIKAMCHITGGGYPDNLPRILPEGVGAQVDTAAWTPLPIFELIRSRGDVAFEECYRALNMGVGIVLVTAAADADAVLGDLAAAGEVGAVRMGELTRGARTVTLLR